MIFLKTDFKYHHLPRQEDLRLFMDMIIASP